MAPFMTSAWASDVAERANGWPDPDYKAGKLDDYWNWIDMVKPQVTGSLALSVRDMPPGAGAGDTILLKLEQGTVSAAEVTTRAAAEDQATFVLAGSYADWLEMLRGYDVGKTIMYRRLVLEKGEVLDFFMAAYYWLELLTALRDVPTELPEAAGV